MVKAVNAWPRLGTCPGSDGGEFEGTMTRHKARPITGLFPSDGDVKSAIASTVSTQRAGAFINLANDRGAS